MEKGKSMRKAGYYTYYIDVWDEHLKQLFCATSFKTQKQAKEAALQQLKDSAMSYKRADIIIMHYDWQDYNDKNTTIQVK